MFKFWFHRVLTVSLICAPLWLYLVTNDYNEAAGAIAMGFGLYVLMEVSSW